MKSIRFQGHGDDVFTCWGDIFLDCGGYDSPVYIKVSSGDDSVIVTGHYDCGPGNGWLIGITPGDTPRGTDERDIPDWNIRFEKSDRPYSPSLMMVVPDDTTVEEIDFKGNVEPKTPKERDELVSSLRRDISQRDSLLKGLRSQLSGMSENIKRALASIP